MLCVHLRLVCLERGAENERKRRQLAAASPILVTARGDGALRPPPALPATHLAQVPRCVADFPRAGCDVLPVSRYQLSGARC